MKTIKINTVSLPGTKCRSNLKERLLPCLPAGRARFHSLAMTRFMLLAMTLTMLFFFHAQAQTTPGQLQITSITDNASTYPNSQVPKYDKLEITFQVSNTVATNLQMPYDVNPPAGITPGIGITVNAEFSTDNFQTVYTQPAFYYQEFDYQVKGGREWMYPTTNFTWKVRFSPNKEGTWQYRLTAQDSSGTTTSSTQSFTVAANPSSHGFVKVSKNDPRYFEFEDGTYFPGLGYNMTWGQINWDNPVSGNQANFQKMGQNGIQLVRNWLSDWGIYSSDDAPWMSVRYGANEPGVRVPHLNGTPVSVYNNADVAWELERYWQPCIFLGGWHDGSGPAISRGKKYKVFIRYIIPQDLAPAVNPSNPFGLVAKLSGWLDSPQCAQSGQGTVVSSYANQVSPKDAQGNYQWQILEGTINPSYTSSQDFLGRVYLAMENVDHTTAITTAGEKLWIDRIEVREDLGDDQCAPAAGSGSPFDLSNGKCGANIITSPWSAYHQYFNQRFSYSFDKVLDLAKQNNVYLKSVILEKNEYIQNHIDYLGRGILDNQPNCQQPFGVSECPGNQWFYGNWGNPTKIYWLQQAWWRYLQARWGYSTNIHSWELLNEGDPYNGLHYTLANNFAKYMHQFGPNSHLVTTSNWNQFPITSFWGNSSFQDLDYTDVHQYIGQGSTVNLRVDKPNDGGSVRVQDPPDFYDSASATNKISMQIGAKQPYGVGKPVMRGETGFYEPATGTDVATPQFNSDTQGIWLHKYTWGQINPGGLIESYWYSTVHIYTSAFDHRNVFKPYYDFIKDIPLSNGHYADVAATSSNTNLRTWGQKDAVNGRAHLWIDNKNHTWKNVVDRVNIASELGTVSFSGMPEGSYKVDWYDPYSNPLAIIKTENIVVGTAGVITLNVSNLDKDIAVKISSASVVQIPGDVNNDTSINVLDIQACVNHILGIQDLGSRADVNGDNSVNVLDVQAIVNIILGV